MLLNGSWLLQEELCQKAPQREAKRVANRVQEATQAPNGEIAKLEHSTKDVNEPKQKRLLILEATIDITWLRINGKDTMDRQECLSGARAFGENRSR